MSYPFARYFHELRDEEVAGIVELNVNSTVWMTRIVLGDESSGMVQRRRGAIVNTSSGAGRATSPLLAEYSGAKSFIEMFSLGGVLWLVNVVTLRQHLENVWFLGQGPLN